MSNYASLHFCLPLPASLRVDGELSGLKLSITVESDDASGRMRAAFTFQHDEQARKFADDMGAAVERVILERRKIQDGLTGLFGGIRACASVGQ